MVSGQRRLQWELPGACAGPRGSGLWLSQQRNPVHDAGRGRTVSAEADHILLAAGHDDRTDFIRGAMGCGLMLEWKIGVV